MRRCVAQVLDFSSTELLDCYSKALAFVRKSRFTDCELIYTPSQVALAALREFKPDVVSRWAQPKGLDVAQLDKVCSSIQTMVERDCQIPDVETVREVDRRLRTCTNPDKSAGSAAYERTKEEKEAIATEKRENKAAIVKQAMQDSDPFGGSLREESSVTPASVIITPQYS